MNFIKKLFKPKCKVCKRRFNTKRGLSVHKTVAHKTKLHPILDGDIVWEK